MVKGDTLERALGILVFLIGIGVLVFVFIIAYGMFQSPTHGLIATPGKEGGSSAVQNLGSSALSLLLRIALLFIMALVGSLVAGRGIQLYFAGEPERPEKV